MSEHNTVEEAYQRLKLFVDARPKMRQTDLLHQANQLMTAEWDVIREHEESKHQNTKEKKHWKEAVLLQLACPGRFVYGGDRKSLRWRNRHAAVVQFVEKYIQSTTADANVEAVMDDVIKEVKSKFQAASPMFDTFVRQMTKVVICRHRREVDADSAENELEKICDDFQVDIQTLAVASSSTYGQLVPHAEVASNNQQCVIKIMDMEYRGSQTFNNVIGDLLKLKSQELETRKQVVVFVCYLCVLFFILSSKNDLHASLKPTPPSERQKKKTKHK